jgi:glucose-6-phosphate 1-dehydrogenase
VAKPKKGDALVIFGATGDLAFKQIFPALQRMIIDGELDVPVVGVAREGGHVLQLRERAKASLEASADGLNKAAFKKLSSLLRYAGGDYADHNTFVELQEELKGCKRPVHYLAIPPSLFGPVVGHLGDVGLAEQGRVVVEKPFGHDRDSARALADEIHKPAKSLHRMLSKSGNLTMNNVSAIFAAIKRALKVEVRAQVVMA